MTATVQACPTRINAPTVYAYRDFLPNDINAEVVLIEKVHQQFLMILLNYTELSQVPGECLETVWPTLTSYQEVKVCVKLVELLLKLFNYRGSKICTDLEGIGTSSRGASAIPSQTVTAPPRVYGHPPTLQSEPFKQGPLSHMPPQEALSNTTDYLLALANRMERIFDDPAASVEARSINQASDDPAYLTNAGVSHIRETWRRLGTLIPYHTGGFYIPGTLSSDARRVA